MIAPSIKQVFIHRGRSLQIDGRSVTLAYEWRHPPLEGMPKRLADGMASLFAHEALVQLRHQEAVKRLREEPPAAVADKAVALLACALQRALGHPLRDDFEAGLVLRPGRVVYPVWDLELGEFAGRFAVGLVAVLASDEGEGGPTRCRALLERFLGPARALDFSDSASRIIRTAEKRGIPWDRLAPQSRMVRLGQGARQVRLSSSYTPRTSQIATDLSRRKDLAARMLRRHGLPAAANRRVNSVETAIAAAAAIGYPVVVKPVSTDFGTAVSTNNRDEAAVKRAYAEAARYGPVVVEQQLPGDHTRLLVLHGRYISAVRQDPAQVVGDGRRSVAALIAAANETRGANLAFSLKKIAVDQEARLLLERQGLTLESVPEPDRRVILRHTSNASRGGSRRNVTPDVHPDNARLAERAAAVMGLDCAGVDLITPDVTKSYREVGGGICEINASPGLYMEEPTDIVFETFVDGLFAREDEGRIPIVCILGEDDTAVRSLVDRIAGSTFARQSGLALVRPGSARIGDWPIAEGTFALGDAAGMALADPESTLLLVHLTPRSVEEEGLAFDRCDLAILAPAASDLPTGIVSLVRGCASVCLEVAQEAELAEALEQRAAATPGRGTGGRR